ncbi:MAG: hypothetical protein MJE77_34255, partial [Proteobacteria bacterium]|nr:hypothetical protein [Pseudomonadota bacterium]
VARAPIHHRQRACSSVKYTGYSPLLAHPLAARLVALARSEVFGPALTKRGDGSAAATDIVLREPQVGR